MYDTQDLAEYLHAITQSDILSYLSYTQILQLKAIIHYLEEVRTDDKAS